MVTDEYHLQQTETDGQQEVQDAIGIAVADQNEVQDTSVMAEMNSLKKTRLLILLLMKVSNRLNSLPELFTYLFTI